MAASVLEVLITGDATQLKLAFTQATAATKEYQAATASTTAATKQATTSASSFGRTASQAMNYAKLGALAFAAVSVKAAIDFNREFTLIAAVTNTTAERLDGLKSTVMDLAHETGTAPTELAHSLYFLASAGLTTTQQMAALDATAKGTAIGLGTAGDLARITANALNAFADQGLSATQVMDVLTAAIREGSAEPDEFAGALGRVLPIADQAGISFAAVAASLATMSNAGLDVNEGVTALRAMLQSLVAPTAQTESAFKQMGLTVTDVVASMQGQGLIATLRLVEERARKSTDSTGEFNQMMRHAIPNIRGLAGALNLVHQDSGEVDEIFQRVINSGGDMAKAFATTAESDAFKLKQALNDISIAGQELATAVLPTAATALEFAATHAKVLLDTLIAYGAIKFLGPLLRSVTTETVALTAAQVAETEAAIASAAALKTVSAMQAVPTVSRFPVMGPSSSVASHALQQQLAPGVANSTQSFKQMGLAVSETGSAVKRFGNTVGESGVPQILALTQAAQDAFSEFQAFSKDGIGGAIESVIHSTSFQQFGAAVFGQNAVSFLDAAPTLEAAQKMWNGMQVIKDGFLALGTTADEQAQITNDALASMGKTSLEQINPDNIEAYVTAVQAQIDHTQALKASDEQAAAAQLELTKQTQAAHEATDTWQRSTAKMTDHLSGLSRIGIDVSDFMSQLQTDLAGSDDQAKTFGEAIDKVTQAWQDFKSAAVDSLTFAPQMLSDLSSAAQQAQESLANMAPPAKDLHGQDLVDYNNNLSDLQAQANLTGEEILQSFKDATAQTKSFGRDLEEIAKIGGDAGKALASSLLESGDVLSAQVIADAPQKLQKQITSWFGKSASAADKFGTQLTNAIVGPLDDIVTILAKIARQQFGIDLHLNDKDVRKGTEDDKKAIDDLVNKRHFVRMALKDDASPGIKTIQDDTTHLIANAHKIQFQVNHEQVERQLSTMESNLDRLTSRKYQVDVGVSTHPNSPWPDEAIKMHLTDPMKDTGFKRVGDTWTLPLSVGAHTDVGHTDDPTTFPGGKRPPGTRGDKKVPGLDALRDIEKRQLQVLFDIRRELKNGGGGGGGAGGSVAGGGTGTGGGGRGGPHGSLHEISPLKAAAAEIVRMTSKSGATLNEGLGVVQRIAAQGLNPAFMRHAVEGVRQELGKGAARQYQQQLRLIDQMTKDDAEKRAIARRAAYYAAHPDAHRAVIDQQRFMTPLQRSVESIFQKVYKAGMTPGEARGMIARVAREGRDPKFVGGAIKDIAKELGPRAAREFGHSLRSLDASTARNAKHQQDALDAARDAFKQMTQQAKHQAVQDTKQQQAREEARKQWMADALTYATHNVPKLPRGHTHISVNHHEHRRRHEVRLDRKRFTDAAGYEVDYARGF